MMNCKFHHEIILFLVLLCGMVRGECDCTLACNRTATPFTCCLKVNENSLPGTSVGFATAEQEILNISMIRNITYMINEHNVFAINQTTGEIFVLANANLDAEVDGCIQISVRIAEIDTPKLFGIEIVDQNDNPPKLNLSSVNVVEEQPIGEFSVIVLISSFVVDHDEGENAEVNSITLISAVGSKAEEDMTQDFINAQVPPVRQLGSEDHLRVPQIDRERSGSVITINVNITDNGNPPLWSIADFIVRVIDVNDNAPEFTNTSSYSFSITENMPSGTPVGAVLASDPDEGENGTVIYSLNSPYFVIDENGAITTTTPLDRETVSMHVLYISAHDNGPPDERQIAEQMARVNISVLDEDDNPPMFLDNQTSFETLTNTPNNIRIATVRADDPDEGENGKIRFELSPNDVFRIDHDTGGIYFITSQSSGSDYSLTITLRGASNKNFSISRRIIIRVVDQPTLFTVEAGLTLGVIAVLIASILIVGASYMLCNYENKSKQATVADIKKVILEEPQERDVIFMNPIAKTDGKKETTLEEPQARNVVFENPIADKEEAFLEEPQKSNIIFENPIAETDDKEEASLEEPQKSDIIFKNPITETDDKEKEASLEEPQKSDIIFKNPITETDDKEKEATLEDPQELRDVIIKNPIAKTDDKQGSYKVEVEIEKS